MWLCPDLAGQIGTPLRFIVRSGFQLYFPDVSVEGKQPWQAPKMPGSKTVSQETFESEVLKASKTAPVLVDFWASVVWSLPDAGTASGKTGCRIPGGFILAKVNTEENPQLAMEFQIQSIPNCILFKDGRPVDQFVGAYPEPAIRKFLAPYCPSEAERLFATAEEELQIRKDPTKLMSFLRECWRLSRSHAGAHLGLARASDQWQTDRRSTPTSGCD